MVATVRYEIVKKLINAEIRQYPNLVIARVEGYEDESFGLRQRKIKSKGNVFTMLYNAPYTPWFMCRNEVAKEVEIY